MESASSRILVGFLTHGATAGTPEGIPFGHGLSCCLQKSQHGKMGPASPTHPTPCSPLSWLSLLWGNSSLSPDFPMGLGLVGGGLRRKFKSRGKFSLSKAFCFLTVRGKFPEESTLEGVCCCCRNFPAWGTTQIGLSPAAQWGDHIHQQF